MEEKLKDISNQELIQLYNLIAGHLESLENEKNKVEEEEKQ